MSDLIFPLIHLFGKKFPFLLTRSLICLTVYRLLKAADLITSPAYVLMSASDAFQHPTRRVHEMWQTDFTYFRIVHWGW